MFISWFVRFSNLVNDSVPVSRFRKWLILLERMCWRSSISPLTRRWSAKSSAALLNSLVGQNLEDLEKEVGKGLELHDVVFFGSNFILEKLGGVVGGD